MENNKNLLFLKEFLKRILSAIVYVPLMLGPLFISNYLTLFVYLLFNSIILLELNTMKINNMAKRYIIIFTPITTLSFLIFIILLITESNFIFLLEIIITIWLFDTFSYLGGKIIGGKKLFPKISSGKTISGLMSGIIFTIITIYSFKYYITAAENGSLIITCGIIIAAFIGDVSVSLIKRVALVKDSGKIMPGHGGLLDRFDSFIGVMFFYVIFIIL